MIVECEHCSKNMSTVIEYKKKKEFFSRSNLRLDGNICFDCMLVTLINEAIKEIFNEESMRDHFKI